MSGNLSSHLIGSDYWTELETLLCDVRCTLKQYDMDGWATLDLDFERLSAYQFGSELVNCTRCSKVVGPNCASTRVFLGIDKSQGKQPRSVINRVFEGEVVGHPPSSVI